MTKRAVPLVLVVSTILAGCGLQDPYSKGSHTASPATPTTAPQTHTPPRQSSGGASGARGQQASGAAGALSEQSVLGRFATAWINWTAASLPAQRTALAALATGELAGQLRQDAAQALRSRLQEVTGAYSRGRYVGAIPQPNDRFVLVTYEQAAPEGGAQPQGAYHVYLARAQHTSSGWRLSEWQPATDG